MEKKESSLPYSYIAPAYDYILQHVDYEQWYDYIVKIMVRNCPNPRKVLEVGCGTGKFGAKFSAEDFEIYGMDISLPMLQVAKARAFRKFHIVCGDMTNFAFKDPFDFIFCVHDTVNYLLKQEEIAKFFQSVRISMHNNSIFMFDITTPYNIKHNFDRKVNQYRRGDLFIEWSNIYKKSENLVLSTLEVLNADGSRDVEQHIQRLYTVDEISHLLEKEGFEIINIYGDYTFKAPGRKTVMINFVTRKA